MGMREIIGIFMIDGFLLREEHTFKNISKLSSNLKNWEWIKDLHGIWWLIILDVKCAHMGDFAKFGHIYTPSAINFMRNEGHHNFAVELYCALDLYL